MHSTAVIQVQTRRDRSLDDLVHEPMKTPQHSADPRHFNPNVEVPVRASA